MIDLRSDTVTQPSRAMRDAIATAAVGDDVFGEDPTINQLEIDVARLLGKDAALFTVSGTMANQLAIRSQTQPGDAIILDRAAHPMRFEGGGAAVFSGVSLIPVDSVRGVISVEQVTTWIGPPNDAHFSPVRMVALENTHNLSGGAAVPREAIAPVIGFAKNNDIRLHLDGARLFNASVALDRSVAELADGFDSVSVCFSKGLGAPCGSALAADFETIRRARRARKMIGGGWRQAGLLAAGARFALAHNIDRLVDDHRRATLFGDAIKTSPLFDVRRVETNMVLLDCKGDQTAAEIRDRLAQQQIRVLSIAPNSIRLVFHLDVDDIQLEELLNAFAQLERSTE